MATNPASKLAAVAFLIVSLSACIATPATPDLADARPQPTNGRGATPGTDQGVLGARDSPAAFELVYELDGCANHRFFFPLEPAYAQSLLPPGFAWKDASFVLDVFHLPRPSQFSAGTAVGGYDTVVCALDSLSGGELRFSNTFVIVQEPDIPGIEPADADFYVFAAYLNRPEWAGLLGPSDGPFVMAQIEAAMPSAMMPEGFASSVKIGDEVLVQVSYQLPPAKELAAEADFTGRAWHVSPNGTTYYEVRQTPHREAPGVPLECNHLAGSWFERVAASTSCEPGQGIAVAGIDQDDAQGVLRWMPGVFPVVPTAGNDPFTATWSNGMVAGAGAEAPAP